MRKRPKKTAAQNQPAEKKDDLENCFSNTIIPQLFVDAGMVLRKFTRPAIRHFNLSAEDEGRRIDEVSSNIRFPAIIESIEVLRGCEKLNKSYENIIFSLSHDIKGPLSNIGELIHMLKEMRGEEADTRPVMDMLSKSVGNLRRTVAELADIMERETDFTREAERVNFENLIKDTQVALTDRIYETGAQVRTEISVTGINLPRKNVRSILYNLLSNALKFKAPDRAPAICIKTEKSDEYTLLSVSDNGHGIEEDKKEVIFERYTRLRKDVEGTGLGLFIVKRMVEDMEGKIEVESALGKGTTFKVYLKGQQ